MVTAERERQIRENLGLVHTVANRFRGRGIEYDDLYQSGCVGLIKAVDRFDPTLGYAFSTYAVPVIIGEIKRLFRDGGAVKVSRALKEKALHAARLREDFLRREGREPTRQRRRRSWVLCSLRCPSTVPVRTAILHWIFRWTTANNCLIG